MPDHVPDAELIARLEGTPERFSLWRHAKGEVMRVVCTAIDEATLEPVVIYYHAAKGSFLCFSRPLANFLDRFTPEG